MDLHYQWLLFILVHMDCLDNESKSNVIDMCFDFLGLLEEITSPTEMLAETLAAIP